MLNGEKMIEYKTILADPPWNESGRHGRGANAHYSLMKTSEIIELMKKIPFSENAHLYLWVTNTFLQDGLKVINSLEGFRYITNRVWIKDSYGLGHYFRGQHELLLFAVKGKPIVKNGTSERPICTISSVIFAKKREHSRKPDQVYLDIENMSHPPFLEMFARQKRKGWDSQGDQLEPLIQQTFAED